MSKIQCWMKKSKITDSIHAPKSIFINYTIYKFKYMLYLRNVWTPSHWHEWFLWGVRPVSRGAAAGWQNALAFCSVYNCIFYVLAASMTFIRGTLNISISGLKLKFPWSTNFTPATETDCLRENLRPFLCVKAARLPPDSSVTSWQRGVTWNQPFIHKYSRFLAYFVTYSYIPLFYYVIFYQVICVGNHTVMFILHK